MRKGHEKVNEEPETTEKGGQRNKYEMGAYHLTHELHYQIAVELYRIVIIVATWKQK